MGQSEQCLPASIKTLLPVPAAGAFGADEVGQVVQGAAGQRDR
jgi:hypothetical protein